MAFPWTLQRYLIREMSSTFALTAVGLTVVITLGGGVLNLVKIGGELTPSQLLRMILLVVPIAASLTLPMAALFSATTAYGRLAGDNEFVACRSGGINMYVLLLPTVVLSLLCAAATFLLTNSVIPRFVRNLDSFVAADIGTMAQRWLNRPGGIRLGADLLARADAVAVDPEDPEHVVLYRAAFAEPKGDSWQRYGTAREIHVRFTRDDASLRAEATMVALDVLDPTSGQFQFVAELPFRTERIDEFFPQQLKNKFLTLAELRHYLKNPGEWRDVRLAMDRLRREVGRFLVVDQWWSEWSKQRTMVIAGGDTEISLRAESAERAPDGHELDFIRVSVESRQGARRETITAARATLECRGDSLEGLGIRLHLYEAVLSDGQTTKTKERESIGPMPIRAEIIDHVRGMSEQELLDVSALATSADPLSGARTRAGDVVGAVTRRMRSTIHERAAFSASVFVLVILGAVLATVLRGSHLVTAFGISFVPTAVVITMIVMGKQLANNSGTHLLGLAVMWGGIALVGVIDWWTLTRVLRR